MTDSPEHTPANPERTATPAALREKLETMGLYYLPYVEQVNNVVMLLLDCPDGERIRIGKVIQKGETGTDFLKDLQVKITPGISQTADYKQIDYNFGQYKDGLLRKRVYGVDNPDVEITTPLTSAEGNEYFAGLALSNATETEANLQLEEDMGVNNQPATGPEIADLIALLDKSVVVDPNNGYKPIA